MAFDINSLFKRPDNPVLAAMTELGKAQEERGRGQFIPQILQEQLREALIKNQFLPQEKEGGIKKTAVETLKTQLEADWYPKLQQSLINSRNFENQLAQARTNEINNPQEKPLSPIDAQRMELIKAQIENLRKKSDGSDLTKPVQTRIQKGLLALPEVLKSFDSIVEGYAPYAGHIGGLKKARDVIGSNYFNEESSTNDLSKYFGAEANTEANVEGLAMGLGYPNAVASLTRAEKIFKPLPHESEKAYKERMQGIKSKLQRNYAHLQEINQTGRLPQSEDELQQLLSKDVGKETQNKKEIENNGSVRVLMPNGKTWELSREQAEEAIKRGGRMA